MSYVIKKIVCELHKAGKRGKTNRKGYHEGDSHNIGGGGGGLASQVDGMYGTCVDGHSCQRFTLLK
jgi:hypothetical protein